MKNFSVKVLSYYLRLKGFCPKILDKKEKFLKKYRNFICQVNNPFFEYYNKSSSYLLPDRQHAAGHVARLQRQCRQRRVRGQDRAESDAGRWRGRDGFHRGRSGDLCAGVVHRAAACAADAAGVPGLREGSNQLLPRSFEERRGIRSQPDERRGPRRAGDARPAPPRR